MPIISQNTNAMPMTLTSSSGQAPSPPVTIPRDGAVKGNPVEGVSAPIQVIGFVPVFPCVNGECRYGKYTADYVADDTQYTLNVFASQVFTGTYYNDYNSWLFQFPGSHNPILLGEFKLQSYSNGLWTNIAILNSTNYGTPYQNNFQPNGGKCTGINLCGYGLNWKLILNHFGEGTYRFYMTGQYTGAYPYCYASPPFCLRIWECYAVDGTVKFEAKYSGGNFGSVTTQGRSWGLCCKAGENTYPINWQDSIRFFGAFTNTDYDKETDSIKYLSGVINKVRDEVIKKFKLFIGGGGSTRNAPLWMLERFVAYGLSADQLYVNDYNLNNPNYNLKHFWVICETGIKPTYKTSSRYMKVLDTEFKEGLQYIYRDRCCS